MQPNNKRWLIGLVIAIAIVGVLGICLVFFITSSALNFLSGGQPTATPFAQKIQPSVRTTVPPTLPSAISTQPSVQPTLPSAGNVNDLQIVKKGFTQCRPAPNAPQSTSDYWGFWEVRNPRKDQWAKSVQGQVSFMGSGGLVLATYNLDSSTIAADTIDWLGTPWSRSKTTNFWGRVKGRGH